MSSSESILNINQQSSDFCPLIDANIEMLNALHDSYQNIYNDENKSISEKYQAIKNLTDKRSEMNTFDELILNMENWFKNWLQIFNDNIQNERDLFLKSELETEVIFFQAQFNIYQKRIETFKQLNITLSDSLNNEIKGVKNERDEYISDNYLYCSVSDIEEAVKKLIKNFEYLRFTNSKFREITNKELKLLTKIRLVKNENKEIKEYIEQNSNYSDFKYEINRDHVTIKNREHFYF